MNTPLQGSRSRFIFWASILVAVLLAGILSACGTASTAADKGPVDKCGPYEPTDADVQKMLTFSQKIFTTNDWIRSYTVEPYKISVTLRNDSVQAIAYSEYLIFTCGYGQTELSNYFNDAGFNTIFADYESHTLANFCEQKGLSLYEYDLSNAGVSFKARYWVKQDTDTRVFVYMLVFPQSDPTSFDNFSKQIFPSLVTCP